MRQVILLSAIMLSVAGCGGSNLTPVTGTVTLDGKPVANAVVTFVPDGAGVTCAGSTDSNGKYTLGCQHGAGAPAGAYSVKIKNREVAKEAGRNPMEGLSPGSPEYIEAYKKQMAAGPNQAAYKAKNSGAIPAKYDSGAELKATIGKSAQVVDFALESK